MFETTPIIDCAGRPLRLDRPRICGVVNVTPDSFSDGSKFLDADKAIEHAMELVEHGADLLDIGGESTRPGAEEVASDEEIRRIVPVIQALAAKTRVPISVDTSKPEVMRAAVAAGAGLINDVYALRRDGALEAATELNVPVCLMHMRGEPRTMQDDPRYDDVVSDVRSFLADRIFACEMSGIDKKRIIADPGFGFGKTLEHNLALLSGLGLFHGLGVPLLLGVSRKRSIGALTGESDPKRRVSGSIGAALAGAAQGAQMFRVHDVRETVHALTCWQASVTN